MQLLSSGKCYHRSTERENASKVGETLRGNLRVTEFLQSDWLEIFDVSDLIVAVNLLQSLLATECNTKFLVFFVVFVNLPAI